MALSKIDTAAIAADAVDASALDLSDDYTFTGTVSGAGNIIAAHHFADATRNISLSNSAETTVITFTFTKQSATSDLIVWGRTPCARQNSYHAGTFIEIDGTRKYDATTFHSPPANMSSDDHVHGQVNYHGVWTDINTTGSKTVKLGWKTRNGNTAQSPALRWNTSEAAARQQANTTQITILEVEPSSLTSIT